MTKVVHLFYSLPEKYGSDFARLMAKGSGRYQHIYLAFTGGADALTHPFPGQYISLSGSRAQRARLLGNTIRDERPAVIVLHGFMYDWRTALGLFSSDLLHRWSRRALWSIWGADLYYGDERVYSIPAYRRVIGGMCRGLFLRRVEHVTAFTSGDSALALQRWSPRAKIHRAFYPFALEGPLSPIRASSALHTVQVGNSGDPSNRHVEFLEELSQFSQLRILCPLAYGGTREYRKYVAETGERLFGDRFVPLVTMSSRREYQNIVAGADSGVFAHRRQQALWNILLHLHVGNPVFLDDATTHFTFLRARGFDVDPLPALRQYYSEEPGPRERERPVRLDVFEQFGDETSLTSWEEAFERIAGQDCRAVAK